MKKLNNIQPKLIFSLLIVILAAYVFRIGYLGNNWIMYLIGAALFALAYYAQSKKK